jgi:hypothetical protein
VHEQLQQRFDRLETARSGVLARLEGHDRTRLNRPRPDGGWSVLQILQHVITAEEGTLRYMSKKMLAGASLPQAGLKSRLRLLALQMVLASPFRFRAPGATGDVPDETDPAELRARWNAVRASWKELLDTFPGELLDRMVFRHGMVGLMSLYDTLDFLQAHLARHVRQVERGLDSD